MEEMKKTITKEQIRISLSAAAGIAGYAVTSYYLRSVKYVGGTIVKAGCVVLQIYCADLIHQKVSDRLKKVMG